MNTPISEPVTMTTFAFSPGTGAFYDPASWPHDLPDDVVDVSKDDHARLMSELSQGRELIIGPDGYPVTAEPAAPTREQLASTARRRRDDEIAAILWLIERHRSELSLQRSTTLTDEDYILVHQHAQDLRDVPEQEGFPHDIEWPTLPAELLETGT